MERRLLFAPGVFSLSTSGASSFFELSSRFLEGVVVAFAAFSALTSSTFLPVSDASNCAARSRSRRLRSSAWRSRSIALSSFFVGGLGFTSFGGFGGGGSRGFTSSSSSFSTRRLSVSRPGMRRGPAGSSSAGSAGDASSSPSGDFSFSFSFSFFPAAGFFSSSAAASHPSLAKSSVGSSRIASN